MSRADISSDPSTTSQAPVGETMPEFKHGNLSSAIKPGSLWSIWWLWVCVCGTLGFVPSNCWVPWTTATAKEAEAKVRTEGKPETSTGRDWTLELSSGLFIVHGRCHLFTQACSHFKPFWIGRVAVPCKEKYPIRASQPPSPVGCEATLAMSWHSNSFQCRKCRKSVVAKDSVPKMDALFIPFESWQPQVQSLQFVLCQSHGPRSTGSWRRAVWTRLCPNVCLKYHAVVRSKGANSWIKVRSPLLVLTAIAVHG